MTRGAGGRRPRATGPTGTARGQVEARLLDLSLGGALLHVAGGLEVGGIHDFVLELDGESVWVQGEVLRSSAAAPGGFTVAVEFVGMAPRDRGLLDRYLERRR